MAKTDDHTAPPPVPKDYFSASVDWSIYRREENASSSSWHSSDKYWGLENRKSCPILEVLINFLGSTASHSEIPIVFLTSFGDYLSLHIFPAAKAATKKCCFSRVLSSSQIVWIACMHSEKIPGLTAMNCFCCCKKNLCCCLPPASV